MPRPALFWVIPSPARFRPSRSWYDFGQAKPSTTRNETLRARHGPWPGPLVHRAQLRPAGRTWHERVDLSMARLYIKNIKII